MSRPCLIIYPPVATFFDGNQDVGTTLLEGETKGRCTCSSTARRAVISPPSSVADLLWASPPGFRDAGDSPAAHEAGAAEATPADDAPPANPEDEATEPSQTTERHHHEG